MHDIHHGREQVKQIPYQKKKTIRKYTCPTSPGTDERPRFLQHCKIQTEFRLGHVALRGYAAFHREEHVYREVTPRRPCK